MVDRAHTEVDDDALMSRVSVGDADAFASLVRRHEGRLRAFLARSLPQDVDGVAEARDLAQEVFVELWQRRTRYEARGLFVAYLLRLARSKATSRGRALAVRRAFSLRSSTSASFPPAAPADALAALLSAEEAAAVRARFQALPRASREAITLRCLYDLEPTEIAKVTGKSPEAVRVALHRGVHLLRASEPLALAALRPAGGVP